VRLLRISISVSICNTFGGQARWWRPSLDCQYRFGTGSAVSTIWPALVPEMQPGRVGSVP
jgi:hypothetical protein